MFMVLHPKWLENANEVRRNRSLRVVSVRSATQDGRYFKRQFR